MNPQDPAVRALRVRAAASTANLGSGFDALGMALSLHDTVEVEVLDGPPGDSHVVVEGQGAGTVRTDAKHLIVKVLHRALDELGIEQPAVRLRCRNSIPHSRGLGSSAAAIVSGVSAAYALAGFSLADKESSERMLQLAASYEGHADNVAASLFGGLAIAWNEGEQYHAARLEPHPDVRPVVLVPQEESATHVTRGLLPAQVPHADAAFAAGRSALAVHALTNDPSMLLAATDDRLHQDYREPAWPETCALLRRLRSAGVPAAVSGAGPTVLALPSSGDERVEHVGTNGFDVFDLPVDRAGVQVESVPADR
ncbi:homoserine kinase [Parasphingorhabdus pacifica]